MDLGVKGLSAFLKSKDAKKYCHDHNDDEELRVGSYLHCMVAEKDQMELLSGESRSVSVVIDPRLVHRSLLKNEMKMTLRTLLPGELFQDSVCSTINIKTTSY